MRRKYSIMFFGLTTIQLSVFLVFLTTASEQALVWGTAMMLVSYIREMIYMMTVLGVARNVEFPLRSAKESLEVNDTLAAYTSLESAIKAVKELE